jgi:hypothetical protein
MDKDIVNEYLNTDFDSILENLDNEELFDINEICDKEEINNIGDCKIEIDKKYNEIKQENEDELYYINLINAFMVYYNNKYNKKENFFSNITNENDTNSQMEIFYSLKFELIAVKEKMGFLNEIECMEYIFEKENYINLNFKGLYCLEFNDKKLYTPGLFIALNYIIINNIEEWVIFNLEEY